MINNHIIFPLEVKVYRIGEDDKILIIVSGQEAGICKVQIQASAATIYPPAYMVIGETCKDTGYFPYSEQKTISYPTNIDYVLFQTETGTQRIPIVNVIDEDTSVGKVVAVKENQVIGYAYNSTDINRAIADATNKLRKMAPNFIAAKLKRSGVISVRELSNFMFFYAVMELEEC